MQFGRPSVSPERLLRALLLQALYTIRSERQLIEQLEDNLLCRWSVGLGLLPPTQTGIARFREAPTTLGSHRCQNSNA